MIERNVFRRWVRTGELYFGKEDWIESESVIAYKPLIISDTREQMTESEMNGIGVLPYNRVINSSADRIASSFPVCSPPIIALAADPELGIRVPLADIFFANRELGANLTNSKAQLKLHSRRLDLTGGKRPQLFAFAVRPAESNLKGESMHELFRVLDGFHSEKNEKV